MAALRQNDAISTYARSYLTIEESGPSAPRVELCNTLIKRAATSRAIIYPLCIKLVVLARTGHFGSLVLSEVYVALGMLEKLTLLRRILNCSDESWARHSSSDLDLLDMARRKEFVGDWRWVNWGIVGRYLCGWWVCQAVLMMRDWACMNVIKVTFHPHAWDKDHVRKVITCCHYRQHSLLIYYQVTTFWQSDTLWFVSLNTKSFLARNCSGSCLNYLIHEPWFLFGGNRNSLCRFRKRYHLLTKCHGMSQVGWAGSMPNSNSDERSDRCHHVQMTNIGDRLGRSLNLRHIVTPFNTLMLAIRQTCKTGAVALKY